MKWSKGWCAFGSVSLVGPLLLASCGESHEPAVRDSVSLVEVTGSELVASDILGIPHRISFIGQRLVLADRAGAPFLHIVDPARGTIVRSVGRQGEGPGEFSAVWSIVDRPGDTLHAWAYDLELNRLTAVPLADSVPADWSPAVVNVGPSPAVVDPLWMSPTDMLGAGILRDGTFIKIDAAGRTSSEVGPPPPGPREVPVDERISAFQGKVVVRPDREFIAKAYLLAGRIDVYDSQGRWLHAVDAPDPFEITFEAPDRPGGRWTRPGSRRGYVYIAATDEFIFGVFSGAGFSDPVGGRRVDVFTWSGDYVKSLHLDQPEIVAIAVDGENPRMWTVVHSPVPAIRVYSIHDALFAADDLGG